MIVNELHQNCPYSSICFCDENVVTVTKFYVFAQFFFKFLRQWRRRQKKDFNFQ